MIDHQININSSQPIFLPNKRHLSIHEIAQEQSKKSPQQYSKLFDDVLITSTNHLFVKTRYLVAGTVTNIDSRVLTPFQQIYLYIKCRFFTKNISHTVNGLWVHDSWSNNFYHWLCEVLPRMYALKELYPEFSPILPIELKKYTFVHSTLDMLGISCTWIDQSISNRFSRVAFLENKTMSPDANPTFQINLSNAILHALSIDQHLKPFRKVYISRAHARYRKIVNEQELIPLFLERGYEIVLPESLSFFEQVRLFSETRSLVSMHGAGHTNCMFMKQGARVMEIRNRAWDTQPLCFWRLANIFQLQWDYFLANETSELTNFNDVTVDINSFIDSLDRFEKL